MSANKSMLVLLALAGAAIAAYAATANATSNDNAGAGDAPSGPAGDAGTWFNFPSLNLFDGSLTDQAGADVYSDLTGAIDAPRPGIEFSILDNIGGLMAGWKTGQYPVYSGAIRDAEARHGIPTDLLARLLYQESRYKEEVIAGYKRSPVGALGIAQFMPATAAEFGLQLVPMTYKGTATQTYDPYASIDAAGRYLRQLYGMFNDWGQALMAYNWGPGNVGKWNRSGHANIVPVETRNYLAQISADVPIA